MLKQPFGVLNGETATMPECFVDIDHAQIFKHGQLVGGDCFLSNRLKDENRTISVLADGLGSGIKASVLATLTSTMAVRFMTSNVGARRTAEIIMNSLPVCLERKIAYCTFTIVDVNDSQAVRIIEFDNPPCLLVRNGRCQDLAKSEINLAASENGNERLLHESTLEAEEGDRLLFFSDGVSQSGMGSRRLPLGWGNEAVREFVLMAIQSRPDISARDLARMVVRRALLNDGERAKDDITCGVIYFRRPRRLMVATGPPFDPENDKVMARLLANFDGRKVACGGTTAKILSRELHRPVEVDLGQDDLSVPPISRMAGLDLITEGTITMGKVAEMLEAENTPAGGHNGNAAEKLVRLLLDSDIVHFLVGTKINEAHQDPSLPVTLEIRRNIIKKIQALLEQKYLKETSLQFI
jgi:hypothetical protein